MGNPLRFFGSDKAIDIDGVVIPPRCAVEVTFRTHQQRFLLRPDREAREILLGCFGRALQRYPGLKIFVVNILSNHGSFLALPESAPVLSNFMRDFLSTAARRINDLRDRSGTFWERRYRAIAITDEASLDNRFVYALTQGTKENLVDDASEWPGVTSIKTLTGKGPLIARWRDAAKDYEQCRQRTRRIARAARRGKKLELPMPEPNWIEYEIPHAPLPHWAELDPTERYRRVTKILSDDAAATRERHRRAKTQSLGPAACRRVSPTARPRDVKRSPAPFVHASSKALADAFRVAAKRYGDNIRQCAEATTKRLRDTAALAPGATLPPLSPEFDRDRDSQH